THQSSAALDQSSTHRDQQSQTQQEPCSSDQDHGDQDHGDQDHRDQDHRDQDHGDQDHRDQDHGDQDHGDQDHRDQDHGDQDRRKQVLTPGSDGGFRHFLLITVMFPPCRTLNDLTRSLKMSEARPDPFTCITTVTGADGAEGLPWLPTCLQMPQLYSPQKSRLTLGHHVPRHLVLHLVQHPEHQEVQRHQQTPHHQVLNSATVWAAAEVHE
ncbi:hypothetical protein INR49_006431, partial [Caranx melampygus]